MSTWYVLTEFGKVVLWFFAIVALASVSDIADEVRKFRATLERLPMVRRSAVQSQAKDQRQTTPATPIHTPFRLRRSFKETRARWEDQHNQKAKRNASLAEQIRKAQEGTLQ